MLQSLHSDFLRDATAWETLIRWLFLYSIIVGIGGGCSYRGLTIEERSPIDENAASQIVIGKTTRSDVFKLLGTPYSIFQGRAELFEARLIGFDVTDFYYYAANRPFDTIDDRLYAMLYRFSKSSATSIGAGVLLVYKDTHIRIKADELLLFVNKATNIVEDVAYRKET